MLPMLRVMTAVVAALVVSTAAIQAVRAEDAKPAPAAEAAAPEPARDPEAVVATVGEEPITERQLQIAKDAFANELTNVPEAQ